MLAICAAPICFIDSPGLSEKLKIFEFTSLILMTELTEHLKRGGAKLNVPDLKKNLNFCLDS
jgi:hypothetical protein